MPFHFLPDAVFQNITDIDPAWLLEHGIRGLAVDVDNTIAKYSENTPATDIIAWFQQIESAGISSVIVSNNKKETRVPVISQALGIRYILKAGKPSRRGFIRASEILGLPTSEIAVIGDQIFTDVWGAKRSGCMALIVYPRGITENPWFTVRRWIETPFIRSAEKTARGEKP